MSKGFRVLLQILQVIGLLGTLLFLASSLAWYIADFDLTGLAEDAPIEQWAIGFGVLTLALSPALWSLSRSGGVAVPAGASAGSIDRAAFEPVVSPQQQPGKPGGVFEPMNPSAAPAPPASSYGPPSPGGQQPGGAPWSSGR